MRAILRVERLLLAGWTVFLAAPALAQVTTVPATSNAPAPTTNAPATDAIGPRELQNFSLPGTSTRPSEQPAATSAPPPASRTGSTEAAPLARGAGESRQRVRQPAPELATAQKPVAQAPRPSTASAPPPQVAPAPAPLPATTLATGASPAEPQFAPAAEHRFSMLPWLLAAVLLAAGTLYLLWRRRPRTALAGAPQIDLFAAPEPEPEPSAAAGVRWMPAPAPEQPESASAPAPVPGSRPFAPLRPAAEAPRGIVASRLRPAIEIGVRPLRCLIEDGQVTLEFELDLFNAGTAPARAILAEASLLNASATQDQELAAFFARPAATGEPLEAIPPMKRMTMTSRVVAPRAAIQEYDLGGRKAFVPLIAFNAMYEWSTGKAQTSAAYLVGRETNGEKLGPLRLDNGRSEVRGLGARSLPVGVRS
jgi:hypothetical protein